MEDEPTCAPPAVGEKTDEDMGRGEGGADAWLFWAWAVLIAVAETEGDADVLLLLLLPAAAPAPATAVVCPLVLCKAAALPPPLQALVFCPTGPRSGVAGALGLGLALSTTHILWERVATSFATVAARVW
jgi:hypothetical protein